MHKERKPKDIHVVNIQSDIMTYTYIKFGQNKMTLNKKEEVIAHNVVTVQVNKRN